MKRLLYLIIFLGIGHKLCAQNLINTDHQWKNLSFFGLSAYFDYYVFSGETMIIEGQEYYELNQYTDEALTDLKGTSWLRETENGQLYRYEFTMEQERLLHDMSLELGDLFVIETSWETVEMEVTEVDEITILNDETRKRITLECSNASTNEDYPFCGTPLVWIEGIGSIYGILHYEFVFDAGTSLLCFHQGETLVYLNQNYEDCNPELEVFDHQPELINIYPNPTRDFIFINLPEDYFSEALTLQLYSITGKLIDEKIYDGEKNELKIDMSTYKKGLYILKVLRNDHSILYSRKIIR